MTVNGNLAKTTYANGDYFEYTYDDYGNISVITGRNRQKLSR